MRGRVLNILTGLMPYDCGGGIGLISLDLVKGVLRLFTAFAFADSVLRFGVEIFLVRG